MEYIGREVWGAQYAAGSGSRPLPCTEAWLHHTVTKHLPETASPSEERAQMRTVERIGQSRFGRGFSYNLAIFPSGRVYVGCGVRRIGSHTGGRNTRALGIVLVGDFDRNEVTPQMEAALVEVLRDAKRLGWLPEARLNGGHRDLRRTACPGRHGYLMIPRVNAVCAGKAPAPTATPAPAQEDEMGARLYLDPDGVTVWACSGTGLHHVPDQDALARGRRLGHYALLSPSPISAADLGALGLEFRVNVNEPGQPYDEGVQA